MKKKIFTYISILTLSICLFVAGVYAAKTSSLSSTGTVGFTATNCKIAITGITCTGQASTSDLKNLNSLTFPIELESKGSTTSEEVNVGALVFDDINSIGDTVSPINIAITIKNNSDWAINLTYSATATDSTNVSISVSKASSTLAKGASETITATLTTTATTDFSAKNFNIAINAAK